jgi:hypothetical protein
MRWSGMGEGEDGEDGDLSDSPVVLPENTKVESKSENKKLSVPTASEPNTTKPDISLSALLPPNEKDQKSFATPPKNVVIESTPTPTKPQVTSVPSDVSVTTTLSKSQKKRRRRNKNKQSNPPSRSVPEDHVPSHISNKVLNTPSVAHSAAPIDTTVKEKIDKVSPPTVQSPPIVPPKPAVASTDPKPTPVAPDQVVTFD